ncbi:MAG: Gfo/Idh/MocA family oxidoreductase [Pirellulales bacterium]|nr:Gfo/Idh/MocA family oxidoreductase [Pirellulales bacterium]
MTSFHRRAFLRSSAGTVAALLAAQNTPAGETALHGGTKKIRLAVVRADTHAYYYGVMIEQCDPLRLQKNDYVVHHYASNIYRADVLTVPQVDGFEIAKIYDSDAGKARAFSETFKDRPVVCEKLEQMVEGIDAAFIADCDGSGSDHLKLAQPFLRRGIPTFVDKPFALALQDAVEIVRLAKEHNAPLLNASILSYVPAATHFKRRFDEIQTVYWPVPAEKAKQPIGVGVVKGVGGAFSQALAGKAAGGGLEERMAYIIHGVCLALNLFGRGLVEWIEVMGDLPLEYVHLHLKNGTEVIIINTSTDAFPETCTFYASVYGKYGEIHSNPIGDPEFLGGAAIILTMFREMVRTRKPPVPYGEFVEPIAIIEAARLAQKKGSKVFLSDVWKG